MYDFEQMIKGYTQEDEFIARDLLIIELLEEKGIIKKEEVEKKYEQLQEKMEEVRKNREEVFNHDKDEVLSKVKGCDEK